MGCSGGRGASAAAALGRTSDRDTLKAADNSKIVVDKIRVEVRKAQVAKNLSDEQTMQVGVSPPPHPLPHLTLPLTLALLVRLGLG